MRSFVSRAPPAGSSDPGLSAEAPLSAKEQASEIEGSRLDRLDIQASIDDIIADATETRDRLIALGPCACNAYLHVSLAEGAVSTLAQHNARVKTVASALVIAFDSPITGVYSAVADNQLDGSDNLYRAEARTADTLEIRSTDVSGAPVDLSVDVHQFVLICRSLIPV